jgi:predicted small lipoprotein YifL
MHAVGFLPSVLVLTVGLTLLAGCEQKGPMEKAGQKVDKAVEGMGKEMKKAGEKVGEGLEDAGKKVKDALK